MLNPKMSVLPANGWVRERAVLAVVPFARTKLREEIAAGRFPAPRKFGERLVAWDAQAVHAWIDAQRELHASETL
jgi:predicted DNA-binding transcriptional regulator AlpA